GADCRKNLSKQKGATRRVGGIAWACIPAADAGGSASDKQPITAQGPRVRVFWVRSGNVYSDSLGRHSASFGLRRGPAECRPGFSGPRGNGPSFFHPASRTSEASNTSAFYCRAASPY